MLAGLMFGLIAFSLPAMADGAKRTDAELNKNIRQYIMNHPEVIIKSVKEHQAQQRAKRQQQQQQDAGKVAEQRSNDHIYGNEEAPISLIEYADMECGYCKRFHESAKRLVEQSAGQVNWIYRHLPLRMHRGAQPKALAAECAAKQGGDDMFWKFTDAYMEGTLKLDNTNDFAKKQGLKIKPFKKCRDNNVFAERINKHKSEAQSVGMRGTPGLVLVNKKTGKHKVLRGAVSLQQLKQKVNELK
jgi:protein-disulfide isomerase